MRNAFFKALLEEARSEPRVFLLTGDLGYNCSEDFAAALPDRFINMGVSEANMVGAASGLALSGLIPFVYSIATFMTMRCFEQIRNDVCGQRAHVKIVGVGGGFSYGELGPTHHALEDISILRALPGMTILCPADPLEVRSAVKAMVRWEGSVYLRLGKSGEPNLHQSEPDFHIGKGLVLREGADLAILATGNVVAAALKTAELLDQENIAATVVSMHTVKPLDTELILSLAKKTGALITLEENTIIGGLGSAVCEVLAESGLSKTRVKRLGVPDSLQYPSGSRSYLQEKFSLTAPKIAAAARSLLAARPIS